MIMRPYRVCAIAAHGGAIGDNDGNGFIWHTTGSGKTLTSFKASTLLKENDHIHKCVFVGGPQGSGPPDARGVQQVPGRLRRENTNTATLVRRLPSGTTRTRSSSRPSRSWASRWTKPASATRAEEERPADLQAEMLAPARQAHGLYLRRVPPLAVWGQPRGHQSVFPKAQLFGFRHAHLQRQRQVARIVKDGMEDAEKTLVTTKTCSKAAPPTPSPTPSMTGTSQRFHVDYFKPEGPKDKIPRRSPARPREEAVIEAILQKHDAATGGRRFNAILATSSINDAIEYHALFKAMQAEKQAESRLPALHIACVFRRLRRT